MLKSHLELPHEQLHASPLQENLEGGGPGSPAAQWTPQGLCSGKLHSGERDQISKTLKSFSQPGLGPPLKLRVRLGVHELDKEGLDVLPKIKVLLAITGVSISGGSV